MSSPRSPQVSIESFVRHTRSMAAVRAGMAAITFALALALAVFSLRTRLGGDALRWVALSMVGLATVVLARELWRARLSIATLDAELGLRDALRTFWAERARGDGGMAAWLARDLAGRLPTARAQALAAQRGRRALRRLIYLLSILALLWALVWFSPLGLRGGDGMGLGGAPDERGERHADGSEGGDTKQPDGTRGTPELPPPEPTPDVAPSADVAVPPSAPIPLPVREEFVVPAFVGDGAAQQAKARVADQVEGAASPPPPSVARANQDPPPPPPPEFTRAAEAAVRARHVPEAERPFVQRYFRALVERR